MSMISRMNKDVFTIVSTFVMDTVFKFNDDRAMRNIKCKFIIKGSTNLKFITPPHLLTHPDYYASHEKLQANDLDLVMVMDNSFDEIMATEQVNYFKTSIANSWNVTRNRTNIGYAILQIENILSQYGYTIVVDDSIDILPSTLSTEINDSITNSYTLNNILNNNELISFYTSNIIKRKQKVIPEVNKRIDILFLKIKDKINNVSHEIDLVEITFLINKTNKEDIIPSLYYGNDELATPIYFMSDEWKHAHPNAEYTDFMYTLNNMSVNKDNSAYLSIPYILHELNRLYNHSFGPYTMRTYYWKRPQTHVRLEYVLKLIINNQISNLYLEYDKTFKTKNYYKDLLKYLKNEYYDEITKPSGDPFFDFERNKPFVPSSYLAPASYELTLDNGKVRINSSVQIEHAIAQHDKKLMEFNNPNNKVGKFMLNYLINHNFTEEVLSYTLDSSNYASGMFGWMYTGSNSFLNTKVHSPSGGELTALKLHRKFVHLYNGLNLNDIHKEFPQTYMLYKGVNMLNCRSSNKSYLKFDKLNLSVNNYIFNSTLTSATSALHVSTRFVNSECCLLRIKMKRKHKVLIIPDDARVSSVQKEYEFILPPNSVFKITNVQYVYHRQILKDSNKPNTLVLVVDCDYMHDNDGDKIPGLEIPLYQIPLDEKYSSTNITDTRARTGNTRTHKQILTGGRLPITSRKSVQHALSNLYINKIQAKSNIAIVEAVTYFVVFINNVIDNTCCNAKESNTLTLNDTAYNIIQKAYAHPDAPNNEVMAQDIIARCVLIEKEYGKYLGSIINFVSEHPEYSYLLHQISISKIVDTYESVLDLDNIMDKNHNKVKRYVLKNTASIKSRGSKPKSDKYSKSKYAHKSINTYGSRYTKKKTSNIYNHRWLGTNLLLG